MLLAGFTTRVEADARIVGVEKILGLSAAQQRTMSFRIRLVVLLVGITIITVGTVAWVLSSFGILSAAFATIAAAVFTLLGAAVALLQWLIPIPSGRADSDSEESKSVS